MRDSLQYSLEMLKGELLKCNFKLFQDKKSSRGLTVRSPSGKEHFIFIQPIDLEKERSVKINKQQLGEPKDNLWIGLVLLMEDMEPKLYLIPSKRLAEPDDYIFIDNEQSEMFSHLSNWEIKVFTKAIAELSKYTFENVVGELA